LTASADDRPHFCPPWQQRVGPASDPAATIADVLRPAETTP
jgi:hypothetical protein